MRHGPFVFYCHPYELASDEFARLDQVVPLKTRLHQGLGRGWMAERLRKFLKAFGGQRISDYLAENTPPRVCLDQDGRLHPTD